jgi:hypothetical protein
VQVHPARTLLAPDVDFQALARPYEVNGGDIRNAVLKAALAAAAEPGPDSVKWIHQQQFEASSQTSDALTVDLGTVIGLR